MESLKKVLLLSLLLVGTSAQADLLSSLGLKQDASIDVVIGDKIEKDIQLLKKELATIDAESRTFKEEYQTKIDKIRGSIKEVDAQIKAAKGDDTYLNKQLFTLKSMAQTLANTRTVRKSWIAALKSRLALLEGIEEDKTSKSQDEKKSLYTFEELQVFNRKIANEEDKVSHIESEKNELKLDLENVKKKLETAERYYKDKLKEQSEFGQEVQKNDEYARQKSRLLDLEVKLAEYEKEFADYGVKEKTSKLIFVEEMEDVEEKKLALSRQKKDFIVRMSLRVDQQDVDAVNDKLKKDKRTYLNETDSHLHAIEKLSISEEKLKKELTALESKYPDKSSDITNLNEWISAPSSAEGFLSLAERGLKNDEILLVENQIDFQRAQILLEKTLFKEQELAARTVESWYKIKHQLFKSGDELSKEIVTYQDMTAELTRERSIYEDKRHTATNRLNLQNKALSNIRNHISLLKNKKKSLFKLEDTKYNRCVSCIEKAQTLVSKQIEFTGRLIETYSKLLVSVGGSIKEINAMVTELQRVSLWHRSGGAISREGLSNIFPDIGSFLGDVRTLGYSYLSGFSVRGIGRKLGGLIQSPISFLLLLVKLFLFLLLFFLLKRYLPSIGKFFIDVGSEYRGAFFFSRIGALFVEFISHYLISLYIWFFLFFFIGINSISQIYPSVVFFLLSIPYLLYISYQLIRFIRVFNQDHEYELYPENFAARFNLIGSIFLYTSVVLLFFREAFILATYTKSELPSVLLAFYSIIVRILLLSLIRKEDLLSVIPSRTFIGAFFWRFVDQYYHALLFFVIFIMILSDPHIGGYDNLVSYVFWGLFGTVIVVRGLFLLYAFCRRMSSFIFFSSDGETLNQRFTNSKTWYGLTVVVLFLVFLVMGLWLVAWFWDRAIPLDSIGDFFDERRFGIGIKDGKYQNVSIFDLIRTLLFIPAGFLAAHLVDRFVLDRIFSVLLVDPGVHNAISTISYYLVVISVITLGLIHEGFGFLVVYYLLPLLVGMAFAFREIFNDFIAYFVLLIQRPLKVGDYIMISPEVRGVVRKITPRAVILRRKRSFHLVVPNAKLMQEVIVNWDYTRSFITFPDILVGVRYASDPVKTKEVLKQAVDNVTNVLKTPPPIIRLDEFGPSGYIFMVRGYVSSEMTLQQWNIASDVRLSIVKFLHDNHIEIAFPVRVIRMMGESREHQYLDPTAGRQPAPPQPGFEDKAGDEEPEPSIEELEQQGGE
jgi:small-conductance mechanosensitive channel